MAKYVIGTRNVRTKFDPTAVGTKDAPVGNNLYAVYDAGTAPDAATCQTLIESLFPDGNPIPTAVGEALALGIANGTVRADETTGAVNFRHGKGVYQIGVGYHASDEAAAIASVNWKDLS